MGIDINKLKESFTTKLLYDIAKYCFLAVVTVSIPAAYDLLAISYSNSFPILRSISTSMLSVIFVAIVFELYIVYKMRNWGTKRLAILSSSGVFHFRKNRTVIDRTKNKDFLLEQCKIAKSIHIIGATGYNTFAKRDSDGKAMLRDTLEKDITGEINIILLNPFGQNTRSRADALDITLSKYQGDIEDSVTFLKELKQKGKNLTLKFYDQRPIWKMIILDDFLWLQHYHQSEHVEHMPVYGISRSKKEGEYSLFEPLYDVFQKKWLHDYNPEYDFTTGEIITKDPITVVEGQRKFP